MLLADLAMQAGLPKGAFLFAKLHNPYHLSLCCSSRPRSRPDASLARLSVPLLNQASSTSFTAPTTW